MSVSFYPANMANVTEVHVLRKNRPLLKILNLYNTGGVHIRTLRISDSIVFGGILSPMLTFIGSVIWQCIDESLNLNATSLGVAGAITTTQLALTFATLAMNTDKIVGNVDYLESTVNKRDSDLLI